MSAERQLAPSFEGSVVIDIGGRFGALVVYTHPSERGRELEIAPLDLGRNATHTSVRERRLPGGAVYAAVFPALPAGRYEVSGTIATVRRGAVTEIDLHRALDPMEASDA